MPIEKPAEWCLFWLQPCLPSSEWAAWAQALFSAAAVFAAVAIVWWQQHIKSAQDHAAGQLIGSGILTFLGQTIGGLKVVSEGLMERIEGKATPSSEPKHLANLIRSLLSPAKEDLLTLSLSLPHCSIQLLRVRNSVEQILTALEVLAEYPVPSPNEADLAELYKPLLALSKDAVESLQVARKTLHEFCPK